ncbi:membrane protein-like protein [Gordonia bronchialis DSM 43247]|uniref:Membrane protein-like protein n=1 Tax=Gordonia bronchialis (strain ATCC 25592 / DSM 43247 / BCRC 13721 / JCM 3198 / KCTC 3076 / NBRC 16047 / NCTC 10667) TaxID=526226 RepID=D0L4K1_GORB4|nr:FUSC family protein [Gordonia bronchialis]ACY23226.1 membrane protein-like protein [Gordonia bronchialis DSM 43247]MCC3321396.1 FUSC family protein [Gordonia bronchialis]QGS23377.1 aromatic acid exporter family protein [Gordonia bronchialis]UAK36263.1 FUSC family protein [Gordonia bronchialis]STQ66194.1 Predicted membrane protein [Gordonia bronchialis]
MTSRLRKYFNTLPAPLRQRIRRLWLSLVPITQCALAAGTAWWVAVQVFDHELPFFAPIAAVISLGLSLSQRWRRSVELVGGVTIGILVGDLFISQVGSGTWQIVVVVALAMAVAVFLDDGPLIPMQAGSSAALVATLLPPGGIAGFHRAIDALIGGVIGILVGALLPVNPASRARRDAAGVLATVRDAARHLAVGLRTGDEKEVFAALEAARGTQGAINTMRSDMRGGREVSRVSPLYWGSRMRIQRISATADPIDNAVRNFRIIARRALGKVQRGEPVRPEMIEIVSDLAGAFEILREMMMADPGEEPDETDATRLLRTIVRKARAELVADADLSETALLAEIRSLLVDLMMVAGMRRASAIATLR